MTNQYFLIRTGQNLAATPAFNILEINTSTHFKLNGECFPPSKN
ncbi:hypothetical protein STM14_3792 [Salmonella enterica subsp. enterica serovar Typhimurium str. 14028S]|uniref:Uncharacterized protein n=1 Tax=Salmonella typhimurium (strain 14028s / SGSC 2262) TaxID=588858 RepID=A0A0F6B6P8_SALT1|nr:hypothetical protein STM14_3792 [Salmonella enterica subsp. enterica serovar Typhimurium str. 14028S]